MHVHVQYTNLHALAYVTISSYPFMQLSVIHAKCTGYSYMYTTKNLLRMKRALDTCTLYDTTFNHKVIKDNNIHVIYFSTTSSTVPYFEM